MSSDREITTAPKDAFNDRLAQVGQGNARPELGHQSRGRPLSEAEAGLADAMMAIYADGTHDPAALAEALVERGIAAPRSGRTDWDVDLLADELAALNADLDAAYAENGFGA